jgi:signal transduction histidine kinase
LFFAQAILPLEETHRTALEANFHLSRLNRDLIRRTQHLAASSLLLKKEIARRLVVEENLRKSEVNTGRLLEQSRRFQEQLRFLSRRILSVQEEERKRISRELHDVIAQMLSGINVRLASLKLEASVNTKGLSRKITNAQRLVERSVDMVHRFARELRPAVLDDLGLIPALHSYMKGFSKETGLRVSITAFAGVEKLSNAKRTALYRVAQEALTNVARHARASKVGVTIQGLTNVIRMQITDDGKSFEVEQMWRVKKIQHLGLLGMRERVEMVGGKFSIESSPGHGTTVQVIIPFHKRVREQSRP